MREKEREGRVISQSWDETCVLVFSLLHSLSGTHFLSLAAMWAHAYTHKLTHIYCQGRALTSFWHDLNFLCLSNSTVPTEKNVFTHLKWCKVTVCLPKGRQAATRASLFMWAIKVGKISVYFILLLLLILKSSSLVFFCLLFSICFGGDVRHHRTYKSHK